MSLRMWTLREYSVATPVRLPRPRVENASPVLLDPRRLLSAVVEAVDGRRSLGQLRAVLRGPALEEVGRLFSPGVGVRLGTVRLCWVSNGVAEIGGTVRQRSRVRGLAARVELVEGAWRCTRFQLLP
ncbi:hypothetical protein JOF41_005262 [Saccharothrix coeruleofusca]|uniref:Rv3235 family protein n=1 Tax=Saccharothrix coeruleofusca TaxID=33919 RepID=UPI001AE72B3F|nr:Rv3235 family protein [Saccharothrix coeruleofusca]MBP2339084.1 hypothetical protein [Saccharothrix coeruleofusca]